MKKTLLFTLLLGTMAQAQLSSFRENFEGFTVDQVNVGGAYGNLPQFGWSASQGWPKAQVSQTQMGNKYLKAYSFMNEQAQEASEPIYFFSPELLSTEGELYFSANTSGGSLEVGIISDVNDLSTFEKVYEHPTIPRMRYHVTLPQKTGKYIAFKFIPAGEHRVFGLDLVNFTPKVLSTLEEKTAQNKASILYDRNTQNLVMTTDKVRNIKVYSSMGQLILSKDKPTMNLDVSALSTGMYYATIEKNNGENEAIKFVK